MNSDWISSFFDNDNRIDVDKVLSGGYGEAYKLMMEPLIKGVREQHWPIILPYNDGRLYFYAAYKDERSLLELRQVLSAHLGSADTNIELPILKAPSNSSEKVLLEQAPSGIIRVSMLDAKTDADDEFKKKQRVFNALKQILHLYAQRPPLTQQIQRPLGRMLRDFFTTCRMGDSNKAKDFLQELKASGQLSPRNLLFLEFKILGISQQWEKILEHQKIEICLRGRLPSQVEFLLLTSLANRLAPLLEDGFASADLEHTRVLCKVLLPLFGRPPLLKEFKHAEFEWKAWAIGASLFGKTDIDKHIPQSVAPNWVQDLYKWTGITIKRESAPPQRPNLEKATGLQLVKILLQQSLEAEPKQIAKIIQKISAMPKEVHEQLAQLPSLHKFWELLKRDYSNASYGWTQWFVDISNKEEETEALHQIAMHTCMEWETDTFDPNVIQEALETGKNSKAGEALRDVIPLMIEWIDNRELKCTDFFWVKVLELLALDDLSNQQDVQLASAVLEQFLNNSFSKQTYEDALQAVDMILGKVSSAQGYDAVIELMDLLLESSCPSPEAQKNIWITIQAFAFEKWLRINPILKRLTLFLAQEVLGDGAENAFPKEVKKCEEPEQKQIDLSGKTLGIYTLVEGAARRAKEMLENLFPGLIVEVNHDHVATDALITLAQKAEYFIFAAKSAKHQAFFPVKRIREDLIYPKGKGASSIVREFMTFCSEQL